MVDPNQLNLKELEDFESGGTQEMIKENGVQFFLLFFNTFFFFFATPCGMRDLSSQTRDQPHAPSVEAWSLNHWTAKEVPWGSVIFKTRSYIELQFGFWRKHLYGEEFQDLNNLNWWKPRQDSLVAQLVNNPPAMQETLIWFLSQENPLEKG